MNHPFPASRILVPDDLTAASRRAWAWAKRFTGPETKLESLFMHEIPPATLMGQFPPALSAGERRNILARMRRQRPDATSWRVEPGETVSGILRRGRGADLIVVGTHARRGLLRAAFGSVAEAVARDAAAPVLCARTPLKAVKTVLAPVNLQPYAFKGLALAAQAAKFLNAELVVFHASAPGAREGNPRFFINGMLERLPTDLSARIRSRLILRGGKPIPAILAEARHHGLVVLTAHRKSLLGDLVLGTTVERVMRLSAAPVLAAPSGS